MPNPNFLFIMADQFRHDHLSLLGAHPVDTPNLDRVARQMKRVGVPAEGLPAVLDRAGHEGRLLVLLDGLDEVDRERRDEAEGRGLTVHYHALSTRRRDDRGRAPPARSGRRGGSARRLQGFCQGLHGAPWHPHSGLWELHRYR